MESGSQIRRLPLRAGLQIQPERGGDPRIAGLDCRSSPNMGRSAGCLRRPGEWQTRDRGKQWGVEVFRRALDAVNSPGRGRRWVYVAYDQLNAGLGPLARGKPSDLGVVLIESREFLDRRPYHKRKIALLLGNMRHFALEQAGRGVAVRYEAVDCAQAEALERLAGELGPMAATVPAERETRVELQPLVDAGSLVLEPHGGWLTTREVFDAARPRPPYRMDAFYRAVRNQTGLLMDHGKPVGGQYSYDVENRERWSGQPPGPEPPTFALDKIKLEVAATVEREYAGHPGKLDMARVPCSLEDAAALWDWAKRECLPVFGPYEDAMSARSRGLFHTRMSAVINVHRVTPDRVIRDVLDLDLPLQSREGFVRQVIGWREFVKHVHDATDGFRDMPGGADANALGCGEPLPAAWWGTESGMACLDTVVAQVWEDGWSHHITRLMILSNIASLLDVDPRELTDWFWIAYDDAYDWVVEPNVLGMGTYALGDLMTTKPYVSGAAYIDRMSDYCSSCRFDPKRNCPIASLYWAYLDRHRNKLKGNPRMGTQLSAAAKRGDRLRQDREVYARVSEILRREDTLTPASLADCSVLRE
jgi:deoxyribodipyrimidine photolyase-related protein